MNPSETCLCHFCHTSFLLRDIGEGVVTPQVIACPKCSKRWRKTQFIRDDGRLHTIMEEVDDDVRLTTRSWIGDNQTLASQYHSRCIKLTAELELLLGAPRRRFLRMIAEYGAVDATKRLIHAREPSPTFTALFMQKTRRLGLTVEAIIITESEWVPLFTDSDRAAASKRLRQHEWSPGT